MERIKIDKTRKQITLKDKLSFGKPKVLKAKILADINYDKFDKDLTTYYNRGGLTYIFENAPQEIEEDEAIDFKSKITIDEELNNRYFAGLSEDQKQAIYELQEELGI